MIELRYQDSYQQIRSQTFENFEALLLAFSGCVTIPDYFKVLSLTQDDKDLGYQGAIGDLYRYLQTINPTNK
ncbi:MULTISPECIES: DUF4649 family protein [unclassified Streptococcus]|uniref:DUF4649 family protein n=1 Tax=unclassified Streptococcus TaxID=2608887 RepID=UPI0010725A7E|nr:MULTISPECIES: DUF4649 family protein [unclassified Streptococcus]MBF0788105.1 DUF4649 family protein [Streptococcus sp. 19428wC2_LYSM12]MCQ9212595.1 DUF4649 family protein [Streptococcus sp. B01]MCQ9213934.1 DUF4649 family protein [Streptococcus sp. O1]TFV04863.1 DUF4649 family protein [Streptococcus sp. LYSM12]